MYIYNKVLDSNKFLLAKIIDKVKSYFNPISSLYNMSVVGSSH